MDIPTTVGTRIRSIREGSSLNQREFGQRIGFSQAYVSQVERDDSIPGGDFLISLKRSFRCSIDWVLVGEMPLLMQGQTITPEELLSVGIVGQKVESVMRQLEEQGKLEPSMEPVAPYQVNVVVPGALEQHPAAGADDLDRLRAENGRLAQAHAKCETRCAELQSQANVYKELMDLYRIELFQVIKEATGLASRISPDASSASSGTLDEG